MMNINKVFKVTGEVSTFSLGFPSEVYMTIISSYLSFQRIVSEILICVLD